MTRYFRKQWAVLLHPSWTNNRNYTEDQEIPKKFPRKKKCKKANGLPKEALQPAEKREAKGKEEQER